MCFFVSVEPCIVIFLGILFKHTVTGDLDLFHSPVTLTLGRCDLTFHRIFVHDIDNTVRGRPTNFLSLFSYFILLLPVINPQALHI